MRKLDDGTYMYDTDQPYERVVAGIIVTLILVAVTFTFGYFTLKAWLSSGPATFNIPAGRGFISLIAFLASLAFTLKVGWEALKRRRAKQDPE